MRDRIVYYFQQRNCLVAPEAIELILVQPRPLELLPKLDFRDRFISVDDVLKAIENNKKIDDEPAALSQTSSPAKHSEHIAASFRPIAKDIEPQLEVDGETDVTGNSTSEGKVEDFINYFNDRFSRIGKIFKVQQSIASLKRSSHGYDVVRVVGIISEIRKTKSDNYLIRIEDPSGSLPALVSKLSRNASRIYPMAASLIVDEVICVEGVMRNDLFMVNNMFLPDITPPQRPEVSDDVTVALLSDTHVGSKLFAADNLQRFLDWLNGKVGANKEQQLASKVKYICIAGDLVDGIGIYPNQEDELVTTDIFQQYELLASYIEQIPEYVEVVLSPGNHDAVRLADPQPALPKKLLGRIATMKNVHAVGSPCYVTIHGVSTLVYHGTSFDSTIKHMAGLSYERPEEVVTEYLRMRHLHPYYGDRPPINPEPKDYMVIDKVPHLVHSGHVHKNGYANYKGVMIINSGTWQKTTPYQVKLGHKPTPCILPVLSLQGMKLSVLHFSQGAM